MARKFLGYLTHDKDLCSIKVMNKLALQLFLVLAFIPIAILIISITITLAPLYCWGLAINAYRFGNNKELYFWLAMGVVAFFLALFVLGVL